MEWIQLTDQEQLDEIKSKSCTKPQVIFKHSTRCSISAMALNRLEKSEVPGNADFYFLDLLKHRDLSNKIASDFGVDHQSPQILIIRDGKCVYDESHMAIDMKSIKQQAA